MWHIRWSVMVALGLTGAAALEGCAIGSPPGPTRDPLPGPVRQHAESPCTGGCGDNGGKVDGTPFWGLYLSGAPNEHGVSYQHFARTLDLMKLGKYAELDVDGARLRFRVGPNADWKGGHDLEHGVLSIIVPGKTTPDYIEIAAVHTAVVDPIDGLVTDDREPYWTRAGDRGVESYTLRWVASEDAGLVTVPFQEVCSSTTLDDDLWTNQLDAVVFEGEYYDIVTREITRTPTERGNWFNIACMGSPQAKNALARRTDATSGDGYTSKIEDDRQALTRAWAADYCGDGTSFTHTGHKLRIIDKRSLPGGPPPGNEPPGWFPREAPIGFALATDRSKHNFHFEAVWDSHGAVCLDLPRMSADDPKFTPPDPKMLAKVHQHCKPPPCTGQWWFPLGWKSQGQVMTATLWP